MKNAIFVFLLFPMTAMAETISEMVASGQGAMSDIISISNDTKALVQDVKSSGDPVLLQCVATKEASINALKDISESALSNLESATTEQKAEFELRKITLSKNKVQQFYNEAQRCTLGQSGSGDNDGSEGQVLFDDSNAQDSFGGSTTVSSSESS